MDSAEYYAFPCLDLDIRDFPADGFILDIGGGGEGVIGRLKGRDVTAIDLSAPELQEAPDGPLKIVMDACDLKFLDNTFSTVTAFFSLMYVRKRGDQQNIFREAFRVLKPGGRMYLWEVDLSERPLTDREVFVVSLRYRVHGIEMQTGYGSQWPQERRGECYYRELAQKAGFHVSGIEKLQHIFRLTLEKR